MPTDIEHIRCNLCGEDDTVLLYEIPVPAHHIGDYSRDVFPLVRCRNCGLVYHNPRLNVETLNKIYEFESPEDRKFVEDWFIESAALHRPTWQRFLRAYQHFLPGGKILDVGCGAGTFLVEARSFGFEVSGQEISPYFAEFCRSVQNLKIYQGELEDLPLEPGSFDGVTAFDVIEHHPDPTRLMEQAHRLLRQGGMLMMSTHDIGNFYARKYGPKWRHLNPVGHITFFTRKTLAKMMEEHGFSVLKQGGIHTLEISPLATIGASVIQFFRVIVLRALIVGVYKPLAGRFSFLAKWQLRIRGTTLDHKKLLVRVGNQIIMDDDMVVIAVKR